MTDDVLSAILVVLPAAAALIDLFGDHQVAERHHRHHDTYTVPRVLLSTLAIVMALMCGLGLIFSWLCVMQVFPTDEIVVLSFFSTFVAVAFLLWIIMRRYKVVTYSDYMMLTPAVGRTKKISYSDITKMTWGALPIPGDSGRYVRISCGDHRACWLIGVVDIDQILMRADRFDAFGHAAERDASSI